MNKYIFPIIKWKIKPWVKYYILKKSAPLSEIIEGTSPLTLTNSIRKKFHIFNVNGNTVQNGEPTPEAPIPVENVSGEVEVKVENKNLCKNELINKDSPALSTLYESYTGPITIAVKTTSGTAQVNYRLVYEDGTIYNNYVMTANQANDVWRIAKYTASKPIKRIGLYYISTGGTARVPEHIMFLKGTYNTITDADYEPHEEQTTTLHLPEGMEMCKIGTYQDSFVYQGGKWYKNKNIGKVVLDGTENWQIRTNSNPTKQFYCNTNATNIKVGSQNVKVQLCNYGNYNNAAWNWGTKRDFLLLDNTAQFVIGMGNEEKSVEEWKAQLAENNLISYYVLKNPVLEEITDPTLISDLESLKDLYSYKGTTHISSTNEPSPVFEVQYYMEGDDV